MHETYEVEDTSEYAGVVYGLHTGDHIYRYIGKTTRPLKVRFNAHRSDARRGTKRPVYDWIRKHGEDAVQVCAIATFDGDTIHLIDETEIFHIAQARDIYDAKNLNCTDGGDGMSNPSEETRAKMSGENHPMFGKNHTPEARARISAAQWGREMSVPVRSKISESMKRLEKTPEHLARISQSKIGNTDGDRGRHTRWHVNRGLIKDGCEFCLAS